jgi:hypothetical protein
MAEKALVLKFMPSEIMGVEIMKSGEYRYASVGINRGEDERLRISYEWKGSNIPEFVMGLMNFIKANDEEIEKAKDDKEFALLMERTNKLQEKS